jgi:hypothetical protein
MGKSKHEISKNAKHGSLLLLSCPQRCTFLTRKDQYLVSTVIRMNVDMTRCRMQHLVMRIVQSSVPLMPTWPVLTSVTSVPECRSISRSFRRRTRLGSDKLNNSHCKQMKSCKGLTTVAQGWHATGMTSCISCKTKIVRAIRLGFPPVCCSHV